MDESFVCPCLMLVTEIRLKTGNVSGHTLTRV